jgi:hypothetical protein
MLILGFLLVLLLGFLRVLISARTIERVLERPVIPANMVLANSAPELMRQSAEDKVAPTNYSNGDAPHWRKPEAKSAWEVPLSAVKTATTNQNGVQSGTTQSKPLPVLITPHAPPAVSLAEPLLEKDTEEAETLPALKLASANNAKDTLPYDTIVWGYQGQPIGAVGGGPPFKSGHNIGPIAPVPESPAYLMAIGSLLLLAYSLRRSAHGRGAGIPLPITITGK